jgi:hypothetical protein
MAFSFVQEHRAAFSWERLTASLILLIGIIFRLRQYFTGRSLWLDEAMLALNIVNQDFASLLQPLDYDQGAPIGFLFVEKFLVFLFGDHEFVLRLFPLVAGITSLVLFYLLLRRTVSGLGLLIGLALFAAGPELVYYSSEVKQYVLDVAVVIGLLLLAYPILDGQAKKRDFIRLGLAGLVGMWFSHPILFALAGIGIGLLIQALIRRELSRLNSVLLMGIFWLANLGLLYIVSLRGLSQNMFLLEYWQENFMPIPPWSDWGWFLTVFEGFNQNQLGLNLSPWLVFIILILGLISLTNRNRIYSGVLLLVFMLTLIASALRLYPLGGRLSLFLTPLMIILISHVVITLEYHLRPQHKWSTLIALFVGVNLLYAPVSESLGNFINPKYFEHIRPSLATLSDQFLEGDALFVSNGAVPAFDFYADRYGLGNVDYLTSEVADYQEPEKIISHLRTLDGEARVWVLITHVYEKKGFNEKDFLLSSLDNLGEHKREFRSPGTSVYLNLYDLNP